jgi:hypothetical protein
LIYGFVAISALAWAVWKLLRDGAASLTVLSPYLGLSMYSLGSAVMTSMGRLALGSDYAVASRYGTTVVPFWFSLAVILFLVSKQAPGAAPSVSPQSDNKVARWCLVTACLLLVLGSCLGLEGAQKLSAKQNAGREGLLSLARNPGAKFDYQRLSGLNSKLAVVTERYGILEQHHLSLFRKE